MLTLKASETSNAVNWMSAGFNIYGAYDLHSSTLQRKIFDRRKAPLGEDSPLGRLPTYMSFRPIKTSDFFFASGDGRDSFQSKFAARASVDASIGAFSGHVEFSYGKQVAESSQYSFANVSFREMLGTLVIDDLSETQYLSRDFTEALAALPNKESGLTQQELAQYSDFFQAFGAYFVSQITVGGTLEYYVAVQHSTRMEATEIEAKAHAEYKALFASGKVSAEMKSEQRWEQYRQSKTATIKVKGGGDAERDVLSQVDSKSLDSMSATTAANYDRWLRSIAANAAVIDFRLTGVWEVCGAKRRAVENAFRQYGRMMRPLLQIVTRTPVGPGDSYTPSIYLDGSLVPAQPATDPHLGWGGYRLVVIDRLQPNPAGVRWSKLYNMTSGDGSKYKKVFDLMLQDLRAGSFLDNRYFFVLTTFGMPNAFPPVSEFAGILQESGAGSRLEGWFDSARRGAGTTYISSMVNYILVGIPKSGPANGIEVLSLHPVGGDRHTSTLDVYFYGLGAGHPYVLGSSQGKA